jgi:hypothetical protein
MGTYQRQLIACLWSTAVVVSFNSASLVPLDLSVQFNLWGQGAALLANLCALFVLVRPESTRALQFSVASYLVSAWMLMPALPNHRVVLLFAALSILLGTFRRDASAKGLRSNLRWLTIVVYIFAVLAKCNEDYLLAEVSCASRFLKEALELHGMSSPEAVTWQQAPSFVGYCTLLAELAIPILLIPARTRGFAILFGVFFHICLATHYTKYFANFSSAMFLLLGSWLSEQQCQRIDARYLRSRRGLFVLWALLLYGALGAQALGLLTTPNWLIIRYVLWLVYGAYIVFIFARAVLASSPIQERERIGVPTTLLLILALLNGISPYVGIKTRSGFSMYSNLRVEPGYSNHLFMPASPDLFGYLSDTVRVVETTDQDISKHVEIAAVRLPYISLCSSVAQMESEQSDSAGIISYERNGQLYSVQRGGTLPKDCPPWIARKLLLFGPVGSGSERSCMW